MPPSCLTSRAAARSISRRARSSGTSGPAMYSRSNPTRTTWSPKSRRSSTDPRYDPAPAGSFFRAVASRMPPRASLRSGSRRYARSPLRSARSAAAAAGGGGPAASARSAVVVVFSAAGLSAAPTATVLPGPTSAASAVSMLWHSCWRLPLRL